jgi:hypothetical protein
LKKLRLKGRAIERPILHPENEWIYETFFTLNRTRHTSSLGPGNLVLADMIALLDEFYIQKIEDRQEIMTVWIQMDRAYLGWLDSHGDSEKKHAGS